MDITGNIANINQKIQYYASIAQRPAESIRLVAVSKTMPVSVIHEAYMAGQRAFGENRVQELRQKIGQLPDDCEWHLVGRLQTNKVKYLDSKIALIHSLDRYDLLLKLEEQGKKINHVFKTLVQVNVAEDDAKAGLKVEEVKDFLKEIGHFPHVRVQGLMTIGPLGATKEETRGFFRQLRELRDRYKGLNLTGVELVELSMGMSDDFDLAIQEGATIVRIGRQIFGSRNILTP